LFDIGRPEEAIHSPAEYRKIKINYWDGTKSDILICENLLSACFLKIRDYADFLSKLKYLSYEFEGTVLYGTDVYSSLSAMKHKNEFNDRVVNVILNKNIEYLEITDVDIENASNVLSTIYKSYDREINELNAIRKSNNLSSAV
jgi:hypothetical protein